VAEPSLTLPPPKKVLAAAEGREAAMRNTDIEAHREVLAVVIAWIVPVRVGHGTYGANAIRTPQGDALQTARLNPTYLADSS
jgi:hypothetical protein